MKQFLIDNKWGMSILGVGLVALFVIAGINGCNVDDIITVSVPRDVAATLDIPGKISLNDARGEWENWLSWCKTNSERFKDSIEDGEVWSMGLASLLNTGLEIATPFAATIPGGGLLIGGLTFLAGLLTKKPGTDRLISEEKQASFNKGQKQLIESLKGVVSPEVMAAIEKGAGNG